MNFPGMGRPDLSVKAKANKHEKALAKKLGARRQPNSGATPGAKGDVNTPELLLDSKQTIDKKITITAEMLGKISLEAQQINRYPGLVITLQTHLQVCPEWIILPLDYHNSLMEELRQLRKLKHGNVDGRENSSSSEAGGSSPEEGSEAE